MSSETHEQFDEGNEPAGHEHLGEGGMGTDGELSSASHPNASPMREGVNFQHDAFELEMLSPPIEPTLASIQPTSSSSPDPIMTEEEGGFERATAELLEEVVLPAPEGSDGALESTAELGSFFGGDVDDFGFDGGLSSAARSEAIEVVEDAASYLLTLMGEARTTSEPSRSPLTSEELDVFDYYINRELSWLEFNARVLAQATDESIPALERLKFLCISSTNLDEFFEVRVARLMQHIRLDSPRIGPDGLSPQEQLDRIYEFTHRFVGEQYAILNEVLLPKLAEEGIRFVRRTEWDEAQAEWVADYFRNEVLPVLSPLGLDPAHPFPRILNKSLNFIVSLSGEDAFGRASGIAVVQAPRSLPRLIKMSKDVIEGANNFVFLSSIIHAHVNELFPGMTVNGCYQFRVTRNAELFVDEEDVEDLMIALEDELYGRHYGAAVRLEVADNCPMSAARFLLDQFELTEDNLYQVNGPVNLNRLMMIPSEVDRPDLKFPSFVPSVQYSWDRGGKADVFDRLREGDIFLHHPFESFSTVIDFIRQASQDPNVLAIKQTVYRTMSDSAIVDALVEAARSGKEVTAVIELRARFDEERNIQIASRLQEAGAHVVYGVVGYKTHAKMLLVVRRESGGLKRYVHLGTGNYHPRTTKLYTDFGLLTGDDDLGEDVHKMFQQLTGLGKVLELKKALQAPFSLHSALLEKIEREAEFARAGKPAYIVAKMNSLTEVKVIKALYMASHAGVKIDLIIRGICRLRPGIPGISENVRVRSIVGRFLEHPRVYCFFNDGDPEIYCSSADWMTRNLVRRVEAAFPIEDAHLKRRVIHEGFEVYLEDNQQAWELNADATYSRVERAPGEPARSAQGTLLAELTEGA